jgi:hypothetical protein
LAQYFWKASATDDDGVIGYQAPPWRRRTRSPARRRLLPSTKMRSPTVGAAHAHAQRRLQVFLAKSRPQVQRLHVGREQLFLALVLLAQTASR